MQNVVDSLQSAFQMAGGSVGFSGLYLAGIIALWYTKYSSKKEAGYLFWYAIFMTVFMINPLTLSVVAKNFQKLGVDNYYLWIVPTAPVIVYVAVINLDYVKNWLHRLYFLLGAGALLLLAAITSYAPSEHPSVQNDAYVTAEENEVYEALSDYLTETGEKNILLWGDDAIMAHARMVDGRFYTLYGRDLWEGRADQELVQIYEEDAYTLWHMMSAPADFKVQIVVNAINRHCDALIFQRESFADLEVIPEDLEGVYTLYRETKEYLVYVR